jgi:hypothetical protein
MVLREFHRISLPFRWTLLAVSWWEKLKAMSSNRVAHQAWQADIALMLQGCTDCWVYHFLSALERLHVIVPAQWRCTEVGVTPSSVMNLSIDRHTVHLALMTALRARWTLSYGSSIDPRNGGVGVQLRTHMFWVHEIPDDLVLSRDNAPSYMKLCLPLRKLQCLARYRLGGQHLEGRRNHSTPTRRRHCPLCSASTSNTVWRCRILARCGSEQPEDLMHFILHCPAYDHIRERFTTVFQLPVLDVPFRRLYQALAVPDQHDLVQCVWEMDLYRCHLMSLRYPHGARIQHQPANYIPADPGLRCSADFGLVQRANSGICVLGLVVVAVLLLGLAAFSWA